MADTRFGADGWTPKRIGSLKGKDLPDNRCNQRYRV